jgi:hypothetical protein
MRNTILFAGLLGAVAWSGCARMQETDFAVTGIVPPSRMREEAAPSERTVPSRSPRPAPGKATLVPEIGLQGKVISVNLGLRFVVLNFPVGRMASPEKTLIVYREGKKVGDVKVTGPQQDDNIVADLVAGEVQVGDEVREN